jgi:hypothetical protein
MECPFQNKIESQILEKDDRPTQNKKGKTKKQKKKKKIAKKTMNLKCIKK